jgi:hypothetical protein|tara:strand:- start:8335 stop:8619 length:285 start_codon:yes stop_codon:yes gene_type:complete
MLSEHEQTIIDELSSERLEIMSYSHKNTEIINRVEEIDRQINDIVCGDTFRSYELDFCETDIEIYVSKSDHDSGFDGNSHDFVSDLFKNPDDNY